MTDAAAGDSAWVIIRSPLTVEATIEFCRDVERLFRINSLLEVAEWRRLGGNEFFMTARNLATERTVATALRVDDLADGCVVTYASGLKSVTRFTVSADAEGALLTVTDDYGGTPEDERRARLDEVDTTLAPWGRDIYRYLKHWRRWSWLAPWRWYMRRVWQNMKPRGRRVTFILFVIAALEVVTFTLVAAIFALDLDRRLGLDRWLGD
jgi:hypothetical protein